VDDGARSAPRRLTLASVSGETALVQDCSQDAKRSTSKLRLPSDWLRTGIRPSVRHDAMFRVKVAAEELAEARAGVR
jgi:hypothetical protein